MIARMRVMGDVQAVEASDGTDQPDAPEWMKYVDDGLEGARRENEKV